jgi:hypothetical protein
MLMGALALVSFGTARAQETVTVERHASPVGTVAIDTIVGALAGSAVSGVIIGYQMGIQDHSDYNWQRTLGIGAVIGAGVGLIWGIVEASSAPSYASAPPLAPVRDGNSETLDVRKRDLSRKVTFGIFAKRF